MRLAVALLAVFSLVEGPAYGKCAFARYELQGRLVLPPGIDHAGIRVYFFFDGMTRPSDYPPDPEEREYAVPAPDGRFELEAWLNTFSGFSYLTGDRCRRVATAGELFISGDGIQARRLKVSFDQPKSQIRKNLGAAAKLPDIALEKLQDSQG